MSVQNIVDITLKATAEEKAEGIAWYKEAREFCKVQAKEYNVSLEVVIAVIAALSPRNKWARNLIDTITVLEAVRQGKGPDDVSCSTFHANKRKAFDIVLNNSVDSVKKSNKTRSFFDNIMFEDSQEVTIDTWAYRIYVNSAKTLKTMTDKQYKTIQEAYKEAASILGMRPYECQAVSWVAFRKLVKSGEVA